MTARAGPLLGSCKPTQGQHKTRGLVSSSGYYLPSSLFFELESHWVSDGELHFPVGIQVLSSAKAPISGSPGLSLATQSDSARKSKILRKKRQQYTGLLGDKIRETQDSKGSQSSTIQL